MLTLSHYQIMLLTKVLGGLKPYYLFCMLRYLCEVLCVLQFKPVISFSTGLCRFLKNTAFGLQ